jgi:hypothetical protein
MLKIDAVKRRLALRPIGMFFGELSRRSIRHTTHESCVSTVDAINAFPGHRACANKRLFVDERERH